MRINFRTIKIFIKICIIHRILTPSFSNAEQLNPKVHNSFCEGAVDLTTDNWSVSIRNSGIFCIGSTLKQTFPLIRLTHQAVPMSPLISIFSSNVTVDLMNRNLSAQTPTGQGVVAEDTSRMPRHTIEIRSGTIRTASQPTIFMVNFLGTAITYALAAAALPLRSQPVILLNTNLPSSCWRTSRSRPKITSSSCRA
jgi:hypothetical protein